MCAAAEASGCWRACTTTGTITFFEFQSVRLSASDCVPVVKLESYVVPPWQCDSERCVLCVPSVHDNEHTTSEVLGGFVLGAVLAVCVFVRTLALLPTGTGPDVWEKVPLRV